MRHDVKWNRRCMNSQRAKMDRARRLFVWICRDVIENYDDGPWRVAKAMVDHGLYASSTGRHTRSDAFSVLKLYHRVIGHSPANWWRWVERNGWDLKTVTRRDGWRAKTQDVCTPEQSRT